MHWELDTTFRTGTARQVFSLNAQFAWKKTHGDFYTNSVSQTQYVVDSANSGELNTFVTESNPQNFWPITYFPVFRNYDDEFWGGDNNDKNRDQFSAGPGVFNQNNNKNDESRPFWAKNAGNLDSNSIYGPGYSNQDICNGRSNCNADPNCNNEMFDGCWNKGSYGRLFMCPRSAFNDDNKKVYYRYMENNCQALENCGSFSCLNVVNVIQPRRLPAIPPGNWFGLCNQDSDCPALSSRDIRPNGNSFESNIQSTCSLAKRCVHSLPSSKCNVVYDLVAQRACILPTNNRATQCYTDEFWGMIVDLEFTTPRSSFTRNSNLMLDIEYFQKTSSQDRPTITLRNYLDWTAGEQVNASISLITAKNQDFQLCFRNLETRLNWPDYGKELTDIWSTYDDNSWWLGLFNYTVRIVDEQERYVIFRGCCRFSSSNFKIGALFGNLANQIDVPWQLISNVKASRLNRGPESTGQPRVYWPADKLFTFTIPITPQMKSEMAVTFKSSAVSPLRTTEGNNYKYTNDFFQSAFMPYSGLVASEILVPTTTDTTYGTGLNSETGIIKRLIPRGTNDVNMGLYMVQVLLQGTIDEADGQFTYFTPLDFVIEVIEDYTCAEAICDSSKPTVPRFYPSTPAKLCFETCCNADPECAVCLQQNSLQTCESQHTCEECPFYPEIENSLLIQAYDCNPPETLLEGIEHVRIESLNPPKGFLESEPTYTIKNRADTPPEVQTVEDDVAVACPRSRDWKVAWTVKPVSWTPAIDQAADAIVCFIASVGALSNLGGYCVIIRLMKSNFIFLSGVVRDFTEESSEQMCSVGNSQISLDQNLYANKPRLSAASANNAALVSAFGKWFSDDSSIPSIIYSIVLVRSANPFFSFNRDLQPINGLLYDTNQQDSEPVENVRVNRVFTYEINTYVNLTSGQSYKFSSSGLLWVFINGELVLGADGGTLEADTLLQQGNLKEGQIYRCDIFFVSRCFTDSVSFPTMTLDLPYTPVCSALSTGENEFTTNTSNLQMSFYNSGRPAANAFCASTQCFKLASTLLSNQAGLASAYIPDVVLLTPQKMKIFRGFEAKFEFMIENAIAPGSFEGFAFVLTNDVSQDKAAGNLGYAGLTTTLAFEFDTFSDTTLGDPDYQHISMHLNTNQNAVQLDAEEFSIGRSRFDSSDSSGPPRLTMTNGTVHKIIIRYSPANPEDENSFAYGYFRVLINDNIRPFAEGRMKTTDLAQMFEGDSAYVGFTTRTKPEKSGRVLIRYFDLTVVPVSAEKTVHTHAGSSLTAGFQRTFQISTKDACGVELAVGNDPGLFSLVLTKSGAGGTEVPAEGSLSDTRNENKLFNDFSYTITPVTTQGNGKYSVSYKIRKVGGYTMKILYKDSLISKGEFSLTVFPAATDASSSTFRPRNPVEFDDKEFVYSAATSDIDSAITAVTLRDKYGNLQTCSTTDKINFVWAPSFGSTGEALISTLTGNCATEGHRQAKFRTTTAQKYTVRFSLERSPQQFPLFLEQTLHQEAFLKIIAGWPVWAYSELDGGGIQIAFAGKPAVFYVLLKDQWLNHDAQSDPATYDFYAKLVRSGMPDVKITPQWNVADWKFEYTQTVVGIVALEIWLMEDSSGTSTKQQTFSVTVAPGDLAPKSCTAGLTEVEARTGASPTISVSARVGGDATFYIAMKDSFGNVITSPERLELNIDGIPASFATSFANNIFKVTVSGLSRVFTSTIQARVGDTMATIGTTIQLNVVAGPCKGLFSNSKLTTPIETVRAGEIAKYMIVCKDELSNNGTRSTTDGSFTFTFLKGAAKISSNSVKTNYVAQATEGNFETYDVVLNIAGKLNVKVVAKEDSSLQQEQFTVLPGVTDPANCVTRQCINNVCFNSTYQGTAHLTASVGQISVMVVQTKDRFGNVAADVQDTVAFRVTQDGTSVVYHASSQGSLWTANVTVVNRDTYTLTLLVNDQVAQEWNAVAIESSRASCNDGIEVVNGTELAKGRVGEKYTIYLKDPFSDEDTYFYEVRATSDSNTAIARGTAGSNVLEFDQEQFQNKGTYALDISASGLSCTTDLDLTVLAGALFGPSSVLVDLPRINVNAVQAGKTGNFSIFPADKFGNLLDFEDFEKYDFTWELAHQTENVVVRSIELSCTKRESEKDVVCAYTLTQPLGLWSMLVSAGTGAEKIQIDIAQPVDLTPGDLSIDHCEVMVPAGDFIAGKFFTVTAVLRDRYGNELQDQGVVQSNLSYSGSSTTEFSWEGEGTFRFAVKFTGAGEQTITALFDGQEFGISALVQVLPGQINSLEIIRQNFTAGYAHSLQVQLQDAYGNIITNVPMDARVVEVNGLPENFPVDSTNFPIFNLIRSYTETAGVHVWKFTAIDPATNQVVSFEKIFTNAPDSIHVPNTVMERFVIGRVNEPTFFYVTFKDKYENVVLSPNVSMIQLIFYAATQPCLQDTFDGDGDQGGSTTSDGPVFDEDTRSQAFVESTGTTSKPTVLGTFTMTLSYNGTVFEKCDKLTRVVVVAGALHPPKCKIVLNPANVTVAGESIDITVDLRDQYGYPVSAEQKVDDTVDAKQYVEYLSLNITDRSESFNFVTKDYKIGAAKNFVTIQHVFFTSSQEQNFSIVYSQDEIVDKEQKIQVDAAEPNLFKFSDYTSGVSVDTYNNVIECKATDSMRDKCDTSGVAGYWNNFVLTILDKYNNVIECKGNISKCAYFVGKLRKDPDGREVDVHISSETGVVQYLPTSEGGYTLDIALFDSSSRLVDNQLLSILVVPQACPDGGYRCGLECVAWNANSNYNKCDKVIAPICGDGQVKCQDGNCKANRFECSCPNGQERCLVFGHCAYTCPTNVACPKHAPHRCAEAGSDVTVCRKTENDCPSQVTCDPGFVLCNTGLSCDKTGQNCLDVGAQSCGDGQFVCPEGTCASTIDDCATRTTCAKGLKLCEDGRCSSFASACGDVLPVYNTSATPPEHEVLLRCAGGSYVTNTSYCPSLLTCPPGYVLCDNLLCALSQSSCGYNWEDANPNCEHRCPDGSCQENAYLCSTSTSCPVNTVLCQDGTCAQAAAECSVVKSCEQGAKTCPDGTCTNFNVPCPTVSSCPQGFIKCSDGFCRDLGDACPTLDECPPDRPARCPDKSCRNKLDNCATGVSCPSSRSVLCIDGSCVSHSSFCPDPALLACPENLVKCPGGECATSYYFCLSRTSCGYIGESYQRCENGICAKECPQTSATCIDGQIKCPMVTQGTLCRNTLMGCPQIPIAVCPYSAKVRCVDGSCKTDVRSCPKPPTLADNLSPCPDGTTSVPGGCATPITCPDETPFPCFDQTECRTIPQECPLPPTCQSKRPLLCAVTLSCMNSLTYEQDCKNPNPPCLDENPVQCASGACEVTADQCDAKLTDDCQTRCRDNTCARTNPSICVNHKNCDTERGMTACWNGFCAPSFMDPKLNFCSDESNPNGCSYSRPYRCLTTGQCVSDQLSCPSAPVGACPAGQFLVDGYCATSVEEITLKFSPSGCPADYPIRCHDNRCVTPAQGGDNGQCWTSSCPSSHPFLCDQIGYCARTEKYCFTIDTNYCNDGDKWSKYEVVPCADGTCQISNLFCTPVRPCEESEQRCLDGTCSSIGCRVIKTCGTLLPHRCEDGRCAADELDCSITNAAQGALGCTLRFPYLCTNGACVENSDNCTSAEAAPNGCPPDTSYQCLDGSCELNEDACPLRNGCPKDKRIRCNEHFKCVSNAGDCAANAPKDCDYRCHNGECVDKVSLCTASNGCHLLTPVRCVDGTCSMFSASQRGVDTDKKCPSVVTCDSGEKKCYDGTCTTDLIFCRLTPFCPFVCTDGSCKQSAAECPKNTCQLGQIKCPNGECKLGTVGKCQGTIQYGTVGTAEGGSAGASGEEEVVRVDRTGISDGCDSTAPTKCFDGSCVRTPLMCAVMKKRLLQDYSAICSAAEKVDVKNGDYSNLSDECLSCIASGNSLIVDFCVGNTSTQFDSQLLESDTAEGVCENDGVLCWDGTCVPDGSYCDIVPPCPKNTVRCYDGSCVAFTPAQKKGPSPTEICIEAIKARESNMLQSTAEKCPSGLTRCEDGLCRTECLRYDGCSLQKPFHCWNRECAGASINCENPAVIRHCDDNCNAAKKAVGIEIAMDLSKENYLTFALGSDLSEIMSITASTGSMIVGDEAVGEDRAAPVLTILPVAESEMLTAGSEIHPSRQAEFGKQLTFAQTVLSVAFRCELPYGVEVSGQGFEVLGTIDYDFNPTLLSLEETNYLASPGSGSPATLNQRAIDYQEKKVLWSQPITWRDVCFARLFEVPRLNYQRWQCVNRDRYNAPFAAPRDSLSPFEVQGFAPECGQGFAPELAAGTQRRLSQRRLSQAAAVAVPGPIYAFIRKPRANTASDNQPERNFLQENLLAVLLLMSVGIGFLLGTGYCYIRSTRYAKKLQREKEKVLEMEEQVADQEMHGGFAGPKDDEVAMSENPMVLQVQNLRKAHDTRSKEELLREQELREEEQADRWKQIAEMEDVEKKMNAQLELKRVELVKASSQNVFNKGKPIQTYDSASGAPVGFSDRGSPSTMVSSAGMSASSPRATATKAPSTRNILGAGKGPKKKKAF